MGKGRRARTPPALPSHEPHSSQPAPPAGGADRPAHGTSGAELGCAWGGGISSLLSSKRALAGLTGPPPCSQLRVALSLRDNRVWHSVLCAYQEAPRHSGAPLAPPLPAWHAGDKEGGRGQCRPVGMKGTDKGLDASEWTGPGGHGLSSRGEVSKGASGGGSASLSPQPRSPGARGDPPMPLGICGVPLPPGSAGFLEQIWCFSTAHAGKATHPPRPPRPPPLRALS